MEESEESTLVREFTVARNPRTGPKTKEDPDVYEGPTSNGG